MGSSRKNKKRTNEARSSSTSGTQLLKSRWPSSHHRTAAFQTFQVSSCIRSATDFQTERRRLTWQRQNVLIPTSHHVTSLPPSPTAPPAADGRKQLQGAEDQTADVTQKIVFISCEDGSRKNKNLNFHPWRECFICR